MKVSIHINLSEWNEKSDYFSEDEIIVEELYDKDGVCVHIKSVSFAEEMKDEDGVLVKPYRDGQIRLLQAEIIAVYDM